jgi:hypothetical protein
MLGSINFNSFLVAVAGKITRAVIEDVLLGLKPEGMMPPFACMMVSVWSKLHIGFNSLTRISAMAFFSTDESSFRMALSFTFFVRSVRRTAANRSFFFSKSTMVRLSSCNLRRRIEFTPYSSKSPLSSGETDRSRRVDLGGLDA